MPRPHLPLWRFGGFVTVILEDLAHGTAIDWHDAGGTKVEAVTENADDDVRNEPRIVVFDDEGGPSCAPGRPTPVAVAGSIQAWPLPRTTMV